MMRVIARHYVKPGQADKFKSLAGKLVALTKQYDVGCIEYGLFQDVSDPAALTILEEWESQEALDKHMESPHFKELVPKLSELCEKPGEVSLCKPV